MKQSLAKDKTFGYTAYTMPEYIEEKTKGKYKASDVTCISFGKTSIIWISIRSSTVKEVKDFNKIIVNAVDYADVKVFCVALYRAMAKGKVFMFRTAAAIVKVWEQLQTTASYQKTDGSERDDKWWNRCSRFSHR